MKEKKIKNKKAIGLRLGLISGIIIAMLVYTTIIPYAPVVEQTETGYQPSWHLIWKGPMSALAEALPTGDASGIVGIWFTNHTITANSTYSINNSNVFSEWCNTSHLGYAFADNFYTELAHDVPFDIVVRIRANKTVCANSTESYGIFNQGRIRANITSASLGIAALTSMIQINTSNLSSNPWCYSNFWINWTGAYDPTGVGYTIGVDATATITEIRFEAYY